MARRTFEGKVAIVTGGASGIGEALGDELAARGAEVVLADRQIDRARAVARTIQQRGGKAVAAELDVRDLGAFEDLVAETRHRAGHLDYLFNNAGIGVGGEIELYEPEDWDDVFDVNLRGVANGIHAVYPVMIEQRSGHIVNTASMAGLVAAAGEGSYGATKHAVVGLTKTLRIEAKRHGVRASVLCPGAIRTPILTGGRFGRMRFAGVRDEDILKVWERMRPMAPDLFARESLDRVARNEAIIVVPGWWKALWYLERLSPSLSMFVWGKIHERVRRELEAAGTPAPAPRRPVDRRREQAN
jgi:NAD(P)-dependent dehydrogenase (short-subunit alcohol dehydrogenase family)